MRYFTTYRVAPPTATKANQATARTWLVSLAMLTLKQLPATSNTSQQKDDKYQTNYREDPLAYRILQSIICGNLWAADRRHAAGQIDTDLCSSCGQRETIEHLFCECPHYAHLRVPFTTRMVKIQLQAFRCPGHYYHKLKADIAKPCFGNC